MKSYNRNELKAILQHLNNGGAYCGIYNGGGWGRLYKSGSMLIWDYCGQGATKSTLKGLKWIIENIFDDCDEMAQAVWSDYHINYIPIDKQYRAIDLSAQHPNVCGL